MNKKKEIEKKIRFKLALWIATFWSTVISITFRQIRDGVILVRISQLSIVAIIVVTIMIFLDLKELSDIDSESDS